MSRFDFLIPRTGSAQPMQRFVHGISPPQQQRPPARHAAPAPTPPPSKKAVRVFDEIVQNAASAILGIGNGAASAARSSHALPPPHGPYRGPNVLPSPNSHQSQAPQPAGQDVGYAQPRGGKFIQNAYAYHYNQPQAGPIMGEQYVIDAFKKSHKWARANTDQSNKDLELAVRYLMRKPAKVPRFYNP